MALDTFVAGRYTNTYNAVDVGITEAGYELQQDSKQELLDESDAYGNALMDMIYRGGDVFLQYECKAYKAGSTSPFWPWGGAVLGQMLTAAAPIGVLASGVAKATVLTSTANTPAAAAPATLTGSLSILAPNNSAKLLFNSKLRRVPIRLSLLPSLNAGTVTWFLTT